jgi:hypothetical protein
MSEKKHYSMLVFSNPKEGLEKEYLDWYAGQHIHDLLRIPGYVGCKFYELSQKQLSVGEQKYKYMIIWDIETDDIDSVMKEIKERMNDGRTVFIPAFDTAYFDLTMSPITRYVTSKEIVGKSVGEVLEISQLNKFVF